jgi:hypothetical protein
MRQLELQRHEPAIKKARTALFITAIIIFAGEMLSVSVSNQQFTLLVILIALIEAGIFTGLAFLTKKKPYTAILIGLIVFIALWIIAILAFGIRGAIGGIIVRIIIICYLASALKGAKEVEKANNEI